MRLHRHSDRRPSTPRTAVAAVEFAVVLPFLILLMFGIWEVGRLVHVQQIVSNAAREGGRAASAGSYNYTQVRSRAINYLTNAGLTNVTGVQVLVKNVTTGAGDTYNTSTAAQLDRVEVTVKMPFNNVKWLLAPQQITNKTEIVGRSQWMSNVNVPIVVDLSGGAIPQNPLN